MNSNVYVSLNNLTKELGVSISTVSKALKGSSEIGHKLKERIKNLTKESNYHPILP